MAKNKDNAAAPSDTDIGAIEQDQPGAVEGSPGDIPATPPAAEGGADAGQTSTPAPVRALILRDCGFGDVGTVVALERVAAETGRDQGALDLSPAAIQAFGG